jgi:hypothetical protein
MVISTSFYDLMGSVYLFYENEKGEGVWHHKIRYTDRMVWCTRKYLEIKTIAPSDDEYEWLTLILRVFYEIDESICREM